MVSNSFLDNTSGDEFVIEIEIVQEDNDALASKNTTINLFDGYEKGWVGLNSDTNNNTTDLF